MTVWWDNTANGAANVSRSVADMLRGAANMSCGVAYIATFTAFSSFIANLVSKK